MRFVGCRLTRLGSLDGGVEGGLWSKGRSMGVESIRRVQLSEVGFTMRRAICRNARLAGGRSATSRSVPLSAAGAGRVHMSTRISAAGRAVCICRARSLPLGTVCICRRRSLRLGRCLGLTRCWRFGRCLGSAAEAGEGSRLEFARGVAADHDGCERRNAGGCALASSPAR
jgi:hypothetical protein